MCTVRGGRGILARMGAGRRLCRVWLGRRGRGWRLLGALGYGMVLACVGGLSRVGAQAGGTTPPPPRDEPYVLHVYEDLVQVQTLVLTSTHESYRGLAAKRFEVQLDGGPKFHPKQARVEGDDPLSLSVLLDARRGEHQDLVRGMEAAVGRLPADLLMPGDRLSVFAYDCALVSSVVDVPASLPVWQRGVAAALRAPGLHGEHGTAPRCRAPAHLWDAVAAATSRVGLLAGRRVLVVVSDGKDWGSRSTADSVRTAANGAGLAIFGVEPAPPQRPVLGLGIPSRLFLETAMNDPFGLLCGGTGGLLAGGNPDDVDKTLGRILTLVRARYILEFARPQNGTAGSHQIDITVTDPSAIVRSSGVAVAVQDEAQRNDPHTVPKDTSKDPVIGRSKRQE